MTSQNSRAEFYPGAPVKLKTGGPTMTLQYFDDSGNPHCSWYESGCYRGWTFRPDALEVVPEPPRLQDDAA